MSDAPRILVLRGGAIGDFVLTLPALQALRDRWPDAYMEVVGYPWIAELARAGGLVDEVVSLDKAETATYFSFRPAISDEQKRYIRSFHFIITYLHDPAGTVKANMLAAGAEQVIYGSPIVETGHAVEHLLKPLEELAIYPDGETCPRLTLTDEYRREGAGRIAAMGENVVAIHPGSGSPAKNWPLERFVELAGLLADVEGMTPIFVIGQAEVEIDRMLTRTGSTVPILSNCSVVELAGALSACTGYIGNDSGVTHVAAAVGLPLVAIYGPTDPGTWGPRGERVRILSAQERSTEGLASVETERVFEAFRGMDGYR